MGALTTVLDAGKPATVGNILMSTGTMTFSNAYASGGDLFDPLDLGLNTLDQIFVTPADNNILSSIIPIPMNNGPIRTTKIAGGVAPGLIAAHAVPVPPASNVGNQAALQEVDAGTDLSTFSFRFIAFGV